MIFKLGLLLYRKISNYFHDIILHNKGRLIESILDSVIGANNGDKQIGFIFFNVK